MPSAETGEEVLCVWLALFNYSKERVTPYLKFVNHSSQGGTSLYTRFLQISPDEGKSLLVPVDFGTISEYPIIVELSYLWSEDHSPVLFRQFNGPGR